MNAKEYLQFLVMMIPTFLVLGALALSLAFPAGTAGAPARAETLIQSAPEMAEEPAENADQGLTDIAYAG